MRSLFDLCIIAFFCIGIRTEGHKMPALSTLRLDELIVIGEANGIDVRDLTRVQIIETT